MERKRKVEIKSAFHMHGKKYVLLVPVGMETEEYLFKLQADASGYGNDKNREKARRILSRISSKLCGCASGVCVCGYLYDN